MPASTPQITASFGTPIRQFAGQVQVTRRVKVKVPGKHFTGLTATFVVFFVPTLFIREKRLKTDGKV